MKNINIAAATALDVLSPQGRIMAFNAGANVLMPNITPVKYREDYLIYQGKPVLLEAMDLITRITSCIPAEERIDLTLWGDSRNYILRNSMSDDTQEGQSI
jgi:biotin synthase